MRKWEEYWEWNLNFVSVALVFEVLKLEPNDYANSDFYYIDYD